MPPAGELPNRLRFLEDISALIANPSPTGQIAVIVIDAATPDQYDELTRALGQAEAELFQDESAKSISMCLPGDAVLYKLLATRFGSILHVETSSILEKILDESAYRIQRPEPAGRAIPAATSIGIGVACYPQHGTSAIEVVEAAISGVHESFVIGSPWCLYSPKRDRASRRAARLLCDAGLALASKDQLYLVYQPKTDLQTGRCIGAEALLRWNHPTLGQIPPSEFVPLIEHTTLVHAMTEWTLGTALPQVARWRREGLDVQISINISMRDLGDENFARRLGDLLERHAVLSDWVNIEVTESAMMKEPVLMKRQLDEIRQLGVAIEIDDYGTGYSGLSYLKYIPASFVKIDQAFVSRLTVDRNDQIMVRSTISMVHDLGRKVVAEGIRDRAALDWLRGQNCDVGQGHIISPPLETSRFEQWARMSLQSPPLF